MKINRVDSYVNIWAGAIRHELTSSNGLWSSFYVSLNSPWGLLADVKVSCSSLTEFQITLSSCSLQKGTVSSGLLGVDTEPTLGYIRATAATITCYRSWDKVTAAGWMAASTDACFPTVDGLSASISDHISLLLNPDMVCLLCAHTLSPSREGKGKHSYHRAWPNKELRRISFSICFCCGVISGLY